MDVPCFPLSFKLVEVSIALKRGRRCRREQASQFGTLMCEHTAAGAVMALKEQQQTCVHFQTGVRFTLEQRYAAIHIFQHLTHPDISPCRNELLFIIFRQRRDDAIL